MMHHPHHSSLLHRFATDTRGGVLMLFGLGVLILIAIAGAGVDFGRQSLIRGKMQAASDLAATSAGGFEKANGNLTTNPERETVGDRYYALNFRQDYMNVASGPTTGITTVGNGTIRVNPVLANMNTDFISLNGEEDLAVDGLSKVGFAGQHPQAHDVLLLMDTSQSMLSYPAFPYPNRLAAAKDAAKALTSVLLGPTNSALPASQQNRVGLVSWGNNATLVSNFTNIKTGTGSIDSAIDTIPLQGGTNSFSGLNLAQQINFSNPAAVKIVILMTDGGNNIGPLLNGSPGVPHPYQDPNVESYGYNGPALNWLMATSPYNVQQANRIGSLYPNYPNFVENTKSLTACSQLKQQQVVIYTVGFGTGDWSPQDMLQQKSGIAIRNFLSSCATNGLAIPGYYFSGLPPYSYPPSHPVEQPNANFGDYYFLPSNGNDLVAAFQQIANSIKTVRIQQ